MAGSNDELPEDITEEYYAPEKRERAGVAWLLAIGTLLVTVLLAGGIFFSGRWIYHQIAGDDDNGDVATVQNGDNAETENGQNNTSDEGTVKTNDEQNGATTDTQTPVTGDQGVVAGDSTDDLPETGPAHTLAIFFAISVFGYIIHRAFSAAR